jgi:hypothetical protein
MGKQPRDLKESFTVLFIECARTFASTEFNRSAVFFTPQENNEIRLKSQNFTVKITVL